MFRGEKLHELLVPLFIPDPSRIVVEEIVGGDVWSERGDVAIEIGAIFSGGCGGVGNWSRHVFEYCVGYRFLRKSTTRKAMNLLSYDILLRVFILCLERLASRTRSRG